jgi:hypothetical protein
MRAFTIGMVVVVFSAMTFGQAGVRGIPSYCSNNCGPYIPLISTPNVGFETVSSSPVGASNATGGLHAGHATRHFPSSTEPLMRSTPRWFGIPAEEVR